MFCRFCGAHLQDDSVFCARCGKRVAADSPSDGPPDLASRLGLKTPYPWAAVLVIAFAAWVLMPEAPPPDLSALELELELQAETSAPGDDYFRHYLSLVVTNLGTETVRDIPVELHASVTPEQSAEIVSEFRGGRFVLLSDGMPRPIVLVLSDEIEPEEKRRFPIDSIVITAAPAEVTYTVIGEGSGEVLARLSTPIGEPGQDGPLATLTDRTRLGQAR